MKKEEGKMTKKTGRKPKKSGATVDYLRKMREKEMEEINKRGKKGNQFIKKREVGEG